jgi:hypothetical protein
MKTKLVFLLILSTLAIYCNPSMRKIEYEYSNDGNILIGHWRHIDMSGSDQGMMGPISNLIFNENFTYSISIEPIDFIDNGSFCTCGDTLYLVSANNDSWSIVFIFKFILKNQNIRLNVLDQKQKISWSHLVGEWNKINRFGQKINLNGDY